VRRRVGGFYAKPLVGRELKVDPQQVLQRLKTELNIHLKKKLEEAVVHPAYSAKLKARIQSSLQIHIRRSSLVVTTNFPGFFPMVKGTKARQMNQTPTGTWLLQAKRPIPIKLKTGEVIFRWASWTSMQNGSWWHPGYRPTNFVDKAKKEARAFMKEHLSKKLMKQLKDAMTKK
jgi:hypothetical protein